MRNANHESASGTRPPIACREPVAPTWMTMEFLHPLFSAQPLLALAATTAMGYRVGDGFDSARLT